MKKKANKKLLIHPILFGIYPILALYFLNRHEIVFAATQQAFITAFVVFFSIIAVFFLLFRSWKKVAIPSSVTLLLFYSYGHVFDILKDVYLFGDVIGRHRYLIPLWVLIFIVIQILLKRSKNLDQLNEILNTVSIFLVIFLSVQPLAYVIQYSIAEKSVIEEIVVEKEKISISTIDQDVYYILVDAYSRQDILQASFNLDTSEFLTELKNLGFYIPDCTQSNYDGTLHSMTSTLNMEYLDTMGIDYLADKSKFVPYIKKSLVLQKFENLGYSTVTFKSLYPTLDIQDVNYYYDYFSETSELNSHAGLNFQHLFLRTTLVRPVIELIETTDSLQIPSFLGRWIPTNKSLDSRDAKQYQQNIYALESLEKIPDLPSKKFVYAHLYITHQPFVFYPDGRFHPFLLQDNNAYRDQVVFLNQRLLEIVKTILAKSETPPIIVIQSDHSYLQGEDRVKIFNAYYFPDSSDEELYETITPVNTFRMIFNLYFGEQNSLLPDISRYVDDEDIQREVPSTCVSENP